MREITGASELIAKMFCKFIKEPIGGKRIRNDWKQNPPAKTALDLSNNQLGVVVYEGGGNLLIMYESRDAYKSANRVFSRMVLKKAYSLVMTAACVEWDESAGFEKNRRRVMDELERKNRIAFTGIPCNVLPFTQVERTTFMPVVQKDHKDFGDISREEQLKLKEFKRLTKERKLEGKFIDELGTKKYDDSLVAVIYFDGNSIGERMKSGVSKLQAQENMLELEAVRDFSRNLHATLVKDPTGDIKAAIDAVDVLEEKGRGYRIVIDHGDEITLICNAHAAPFALDAYFKSLKEKGKDQFKACAGMAICHSHDPFAEVYKIAEQCCESGKKLNRKKQRDVMAQKSDEEARAAALAVDASYIDFHHIRAGIMGGLEQIRAAQDGELIARPYVVGGSYDGFITIGETLAKSAIQRSDIKALNRAILRGESWYELEYARLTAKDPDAMDKVAAEAKQHELDLKKVLFDVTSMWDVYDLRFGPME
jgi:hypothetical protein